MVKSLFVANWKMNMLAGEARQFAAKFLSLSQGTKVSEHAWIAPPLSSLHVLGTALGAESGIRIGVQNVHWLDSGAHTGEVSVPMVKELGASFAIIGHSERRQFYGETDETVAMRCQAALKGGLQAIVCVGESRSDFESGKTFSIVEHQLRVAISNIHPELTKFLVIAYEPVWAIGTGLAATPERVSEVHLFIRKELDSILGRSAGSITPILYGGSTNPDNISEIMSKENVNGALIGGASLKVDSFFNLIKNGLGNAA